ncbi:hypothetical protein BS47DRAFT_1334307 [Hydnum rufescens UP504]|uniref:tRNA-splicing endonuclease subunit Sen34 n=1 Tax=Hydnum rufescens UP504 TaxID=1448309 RepID=A0A9P6AH33_9AGAM|nr:hypothetical protein BS47DRAFT_1334307 [Hydnum rufescens UP504]
MADSSKSKIPIHVSNKKALVWNPEDASTLRSKYRVTGTLIGTLPSISQQNVFLGLPLLLMPEEVVLLVGNGVAVLLDDSTSHRTSTAPELREWHARRIKSAHAQIALPNDASSSSSPEALRKRAEREAMRAARQSALAEMTKRRGMLQVRSPAPVVLDSLPPYTVHIPSTSDGLSWYNPAEYDTLSAASAAGIWTYPSTYEERARCAVFRALSEKGYYMGGGIRFGGDWLVYPGDPLRYHSHFVATVYPKPTSSLRPIDIVALGRLGTATKKAHLLCGWDEENDSVDFYSIEWAGFG